MFKYHLQYGLRLLSRQIADRRWSRWKNKERAVGSEYDLSNNGCVSVDHEQPFVLKEIEPMKSLKIGDEIIHETNKS